MAITKIILKYPENLEKEVHRISRFFDAMLFKLSKNASKESFDKVDLQTVIGLLKEEVEELEQAIQEGSSVETLLEGADVANYALIAAVVAIDRGTMFTESGKETLQLDTYDQWTTSMKAKRNE